MLATCFQVWKPVNGTLTIQSVVSGLTRELVNSAHSEGPPTDLLNQNLRFNKITRWLIWTRKFERQLLFSKHWQSGSNGPGLPRQPPLGAVWWLAPLRSTFALQFPGACTRPGSLTSIKCLSPFTIRVALKIYYKMKFTISRMQYIHSAVQLSLLSSSRTPWLPRKEVPYLFSGGSPVSSSHSPWQTLIQFLSLWVCSFTYFI